MKVVRKMMNAIDKALDVILLVNVGSQQNFSSKDKDVGTTAAYDSYLEHQAFAKKLQATDEDRRRRGHDQYYGYNW